MIVFTSFSNNCNPSLSQNNDHAKNHSKFTLPPKKHQENQLQQGDCQPLAPQQGPPQNYSRLPPPPPFGGQASTKHFCLFVFHLPTTVFTIFQNVYSLDDQILAFEKSHGEFLAADPSSCRRTLKTNNRKNFFVKKINFRSEPHSALIITHHHHYC